TPQPLNTGSTSPSASGAKNPRRPMDSDIRVDMTLGFGAGMGDRALLGITHRHRVAPDRARLIIVLARLPGLAALGELSLGEVDVQCPLRGVEADDVAVLQQADWPAHRRLRPDMANAEAAGRAREAPVGDERYLVAHALAIERRGGRQHLAHARPAARPLV